MNKVLPLLLTVVVAALLLSFQPAAQATPDNVDQLIHDALMLDAHPRIGGIVYRNNCANCHGVRAEGNKKGMPTLAGQRVAYLVKQFADFSERDRDSRTMHRVIASKALNDQQTWIDVAAFLNAMPLAKTAENGKGKNLLLGEAIFREQCSSCHEEDARGDDDGFVPSLRAQHYSYLLGQMHAFVNGHRRNVDPDLDRFLATIKDDEMEATADYLSRMQTATKDRLKMRPNGVTTD